MPSVLAVVLPMVGHPVERLCLVAEVGVQYNNHGWFPHDPKPDEHSSALMFQPILDLCPDILDINRANYYAMPRRKVSDADVGRWFASSAAKQSIPLDGSAVWSVTSKKRFGGWKTDEFSQRGWVFKHGSSARDSYQHLLDAWVLDDGRMMLSAQLYEEGDHRSGGLTWHVLASMSHRLGLQARYLTGYFPEEGAGLAPSARSPEPSATMPSPTVSASSADAAASNDAGTRDGSVHPRFDGLYVVRDANADTSNFVRFFADGTAVTASTSGASNSAAKIAGWLFPDATRDCYAVSYRITNGDVSFDDLGKRGTIHYSGPMTKDGLSVTFSIHSEITGYKSEKEYHFEEV